jgi:hypothetical protein
MLQVRDQEATHVTTLEAVLTAGGVTPTAACEYTVSYYHRFNALAIIR